jgi:threonine synthase
MARQIEAGESNAKKGSCQMYATSLSCTFCGAQYPLSDLGMCPRCARTGEESALNETLGVRYDLEALRRHLDRDEMARRPAGLWRYAELLPVADPALRIDLGTGGTRLARLSRLPQSTERGLLMKVEGSNPTGSFKDRPIGVAACVALERGARGLACLTSGNIGSALAALAARAGVPALVLLLGSAGQAARGGTVSVEKYVQVSVYGARVATPVGELGTLYALADRLASESGWSFLHTFQAYQSEGDKTTAFEICEQLAWQAPAAVFVPTGTGTNLYGLWQGFRLFQALGFIQDLPRMFAVQPEGAASLAVAWEQHLEVPAVLEYSRPNVAPPISHRVSGYHAYRAIQESGGGALAVADAAMYEALSDLAMYEGIYCEVASAAALAGIRQALAHGLLTSDEVQVRGVVGILTSSGLKNSVALSNRFPPPPQIEATEQALRKFLI